MIHAMRVYDWMSPAETVSPHLPFRRALAKMIDKDVRCLVVVEDERAIGILTLGDIRAAMPYDQITRHIWDINQTWETITVGRIMSHLVISIEPQTTIANAARMMLKYHISRLPVVDQQGHLLGLFTSQDIYRMLVTLRRPPEQAENAELAEVG